MAIYRDHLPQLDGELFLTDGGMETTLVFKEGIELPEFASFPLLKDESGRTTLRNYFTPYIEVARELNANLLLETATWRASSDWGRKLGFDAEEMTLFNRRSVDMLLPIRALLASEGIKVVISGNIGPRGDGYVAGEQMSAEEAEAYHASQIQTFADSEADMVCVLTLTYADEAIGIARAAKAAGMPVAISFTLETDGRLPNGETLGDAIEAVDRATDSYPAYFMVNCAHPTHFAHLFDQPQAWHKRIRGIRANASCKSHEELDESPTLDEGNPSELGAQMAELRQLLPDLNVLGGCCGTDHRHIHEIGYACHLNRAA